MLSQKFHELVFIFVQKHKYSNDLLHMEVNCLVCTCFYVYNNFIISMDFLGDLTMKLKQEQKG